MTNELKEHSFNREKAIRCFLQLPGVGKRIASDFWRLGLTSIEDFKHYEAEQLYDWHNELRGKKDNKTMLYIIRCAIYISRTPTDQQSPEKRIWWNWKDQHG